MGPIRPNLKTNFYLQKPPEVIAAYVALTEKGFLKEYLLCFVDSDKVIHCFSAPAPSETVQFELLRSFSDPGIFLETSI
ncbi:hypothetical protein H5410_038776 [Solanum commersonii]|uniref:Uncharacterized protein n=1 Tax=Solanum commersonii TaxID=4109 RepID=A0A9J5YD93_SOLCO|nr:hypothetical protein H5410_038776 [Solanum commersonii]